MLVTHLEASLLEEEAPATELGAAIAEHQRLIAGRERRPDYGRALELLEHAQRVVLERTNSVAPQRGPVPA